MSCQASKSNIRIVQDSLLASFLMTKGKVLIPEQTFQNICMKGDGWTIEYIQKKIQHIRKVLQQLGKRTQAFTGKGLFSMLLPDTLIYSKKNNADLNEPEVKIYRGVLYEGAINKDNLGSGHSSLITILHKEYGKKVAYDFINNVQFISDTWLLTRGFSVNIGDCIATKENEIRNVTMKCILEAKAVEEQTQHSGIRETRVNSALSKAKDIGMRLAKEALSKDNNFIATVTSGSKGDYFNIAQISGLLAQQTVSGQRIQPVLNKGRRTLPHYDMEIKDDKIRYESQGFISHSFIHGLNPKEFFFHAMSAREGITNKLVFVTSGLKRVKPLSPVKHWAKYLDAGNSLESKLLLFALDHLRWSRRIRNNREEHD